MTRQHQNHFGILGSSPPGFREGYLYMCFLKDISLCLIFDIRLGMKLKGTCFGFGWVGYHQNKGSLLKGKGVSKLKEWFNR